MSDKSKKFMEMIKAKQKSKAKGKSKDKATDEKSKEKGFPKKIKESADISKFINCICNDDFANATKALQAVVEEKIKARIEKLTSK